MIQIDCSEILLCAVLFSLSLREMVRCTIRSAYYLIRNGELSKSLASNNIPIVLGAIHACLYMAMMSFIFFKWRFISPLIIATTIL